MVYLAVQVQLSDTVVMDASRQLRRRDYKEPTESDTYVKDFTVPDGESSKPIKPTKEDKDGLYPIEVIEENTCKNNVLHSPESSCSSCSARCFCYQ